MIPDQTLDLSQRGCAQRDHRLDVLRGAAILLVFLRHLDPLEGFWQLPVRLPTYVFNDEFAILSVGVLLLVSLMLFAQRVDRGVSYLARRVRHLFLLLAICSALQFAMYALVSRERPPLGLHELWLAGPSLPIVGDSVFYFILNLTVLTVVGWFYFRLPERSRDYLGAAIVATSAVAFEVLAVTRLHLPYYSPLNFLVFVPVADFLLRYRDELSRRLWLIVGLFGVFVLQDMLLQSPFPFSRGDVSEEVFARPSVVLGGLALVVVFQRYPIPRLPLLELAGRYSLGIYVVHKWLWYPLAVAAGQASRIPMSGYFEPLLVTAATAAATCLVVALLSVTRFRFLVTGG